MKKRSRLAIKMAFGIALLGVLICAVSSLIGYHQYKATIEKQYNDTAYQCAEVALSYLGRDELQEYARAVNDFHNGQMTQEELDSYREREAYQQTQMRIETLRKAMGANDVFLLVLDRQELMSYTGTREGWEPLYYIFDSYTVPEYSYTLGDSGSFNPDYIQELYDIAVTGKRSESYFFSDGDYGACDGGADRSVYSGVCDVSVSLCGAPYQSDRAGDGRLCGEQQSYVRTACAD